MAGEKFIALEETSQEIKTAVEGVNTSVTELKEDVGDSAGTDLVTRVENLATQVSGLQTAVEALASGSGEKFVNISDDILVTVNSGVQTLNNSTSGSAMVLNNEGNEAVYLFNVYGRVRIKANLYVDYVSNSATATLKIYKNGELYTSCESKVADAKNEIYADIFVHKGDVLYFYLNHSATNAYRSSYLKNLRIFGTIGVLSEPILSLATS